MTTERHFNLEPSSRSASTRIASTALSPPKAPQPLNPCISYSANLMLDEPPLMVRTIGSADFAGDVPVIVEPSVRTRPALRGLPCNRCEECSESPALARPGRTGRCFRYRPLAGLAPGAMSSASRKMPASGLRIWTKQEETKQSTNLSRLNLRIRYAFSSRASLLITTILSPCRTLS